MQWRDSTLFFLCTIYTKLIWNKKCPLRMSPSIENVAISIPKATTNYDECWTSVCSYCSAWIAVHMCARIWPRRYARFFFYEFCVTLSMKERLNYWFPRAARSLSLSHSDDLALSSCVSCTHSRHTDTRRHFIAINLAVTFSKHASIKPASIVNA